MIDEPYLGKKHFFVWDEGSRAEFQFVVFNFLGVNIEKMGWFKNFSTADNYIRLLEKERAEQESKAHR